MKSFFQTFKKLIQVVRLAYTTLFQWHLSSLFPPQFRSMQKFSCALMFSVLFRPILFFKSFSTIGSL
eukprot:m.396814 g.396814  ORF g.396814 m.396814 type:complete len:67 (-) comp21115_c0_seq7:2647-2847(-)